MYVSILYKCISRSISISIYLEGSQATWVDSAPHKKLTLTTPSSRHEKPPFRKVGQGGSNNSQTICVIDVARDCLTEG